MPLYGQFEPQETLAGCFGVFYHVSQRYGLPEALYLDRAGQFTTTRHGGIHVFQRDDKPTHFEIAMQTLAVQLIFADSPQARGRGERINQSFQDRLVAELDYHHITDPAKATDYLNRVFIPKYANHFGVKPRNPNSAFRPIPESLDLRTVLCAKTTREVTNDNTISYQGQIYQLKPNTRTVCIAGTKVSVQEWFDGSIHVRHERAGTIAVQKRPEPVRSRHQTARSPHDILAVPTKLCTAVARRNRVRSSPISVYRPPAICGPAPGRPLKRCTSSFSAPIRCISASYSATVAWTACNCWMMCKASRRLVSITAAGTVIGS